MFKFRNLSFRSTALLLVFLSAAAVALASVVEVKMSNNTLHEIPVTIHCECGFHDVVNLEPISTTFTEMPSMVTHIIVNQQSIFIGQEKNVVLETGDVVTVRFEGIDDVEIF